MDEDIGVGDISLTDDAMPGFEPADDAMFDDVVVKKEDDVTMIDANDFDQGKMVKPLFPVECGWWKF